ncbi:ENTH-domain-containing protein [Dichomitus squalens]|uniref:ENTH-domain-containing protein n=1 Tax=Dichomitus squalens TaxID=114155 RepID=A0A4Q9MBM1_9APHY|nr:ENTH-domain-containing protein [Dichomitus squalens]
MDRLESLGNALSQITMYDIKSMVNQAKNVVFNVSEMEAKVRDATNDEPWGASSTLMQEIAQGTFNFQNFNEVMPAIYSRFMEKEARQWRQIYKALQLLEYLIKNGSERVVDDARSHIGTIKMLRNFYYVDEKGKDQGINVRNRSKELVDLLGDVEKIRTERRKAKANKHKYTGVGNDALSFNSGGGRYGGFGSDSFYSGGSYSGGGSSSYSGGDRDYDRYDAGESRTYGSSGSNARRGFQEYDAGDDDVVPRRSNSVAGTSSSVHASTPQRSSTLPPAPIEPPKAQPVIDLLGMDDDAFGSTVSAPPEKALPPTGSQPLQGGGDDDFDDFQSAPPSAAPTNNAFFNTVPAAAPTALPLPLSAQPLSPPATQTQVPAQNANNLFNLLSTGAPAGAARTPYTSPPAVPTQNMMRPLVASPPPLGGAPLIPNRPLQPTSPPPRATTTSPGFGGGAPQQQKPAASFDDLWNLSLSSSAASKPNAPAAPQKSMKDLEKEKAQATFWGAGQSKPPAAAGFGAFGGASASAAPPASSQSAHGLDDLLF